MAMDRFLEKNSNSSDVVRKRKVMEICFTTIHNKYISL